MADVIPEGVVGEFNPDGTIKTEARLCAVTNNPVLEQHHTVLRLDATHFVRVLSQQVSRLSDDLRAALIASYTSKTKTKAAEKAAEGEVHAD